MHVNVDGQKNEKPWRRIIRQCVNGRRADPFSPLKKKQCEYDAVLNRINEIRVKLKGVSQTELDMCPSYGDDGPTGPALAFKHWLCI